VAREGLALSSRREIILQPRADELHHTLRPGLQRLASLQAHQFQGDNTNWEQQFNKLYKLIAAVLGIPGPRHRPPTGTTVDVPADARDSRVFVSYVREDEGTVDRLTRELAAYGTKVWLDKTDLKPGHRWKDEIRAAISEGGFFIACFSDAYSGQSKSYMNEELALALEELRRRPTDRTWFIWPPRCTGVAGRHSR
jgi:hypothetical protein